ncbi:MAG: hypothetical protein R2834_19725 [Rhodothermales bacterium]
MSSLRQWIPKLLVESFFIVFSILLAFALNGWWGARQRQALADRALTDFVQEIRQNRENLQEVIPYHIDLRKKFSDIVNAGTVRTFADLDQLNGFQGFRPAFLTTTAWETAIATGALTELKYDDVAALSELYTMQERFVEISMPNFMLGSGSFSDANINSTMLTAMLYLGDVTAGEDRLTKIYDRVLQQLGASEQ